jgi:hypothetical protein
MALYRKPYPAWILAGMDLLAAGILMASFRDAWSVVSSLGEHAGTLTNAVVAGAVVLAIDASILLLEQARSQIKLRGGSIRYNDLWVLVLIFISAMLNVRYLASVGSTTDRTIGCLLGIAIPSTIAVLGYLKGDMLAYNARCRQDDSESIAGTPDPASEPPRPLHASCEPGVPLFRISKSA